MPRILFLIFVILLSTIAVAARETPTGISASEPTQTTSSSQEDRFNKLGDDYYRQKDFRSAVAQYDMALRVSPNSAHALYWKGFAQISLNDPNDALATFTRRLRVPPANPTSHYAAGYAYAILA